MSDTCQFDTGWGGKCCGPVHVAGMCEEHATAVCMCCGSPATHSCIQTGQLVCGESLCDECEHTIFPDGTNGGIGFNCQPLPEGLQRHVRKSEQQFTPWYMRDVPCPPATAKGGE